ncbi:hypothetical protein KGF41_13915 [Clostridioides sp. ZZV14-6150]|uniref:hypothetical protein n=1 Tax=Clostridioides sp. ZZV14-6150 TaxID=2811493 RepID=UPI001D0FB27C|nr:hypothetical protein [Clostridioides sp. ZZV14-6150]
MEFKKELEVMEDSEIKFIQSLNRINNNIRINEETKICLGKEIYASSRVLSMLCDLNEIYSKQNK